MTYQRSPEMRKAETILGVLALSTLILTGCAPMAAPVAQAAAAESTISPYGSQPDTVSRLFVGTTPVPIQQTETLSQTTEVHPNSQKVNLISLRIPDPAQSCAESGADWCPGWTQVSSDPGGLSYFVKSPTGIIEWRSREGNGLLAWWDAESMQWVGMNPYTPVSGQP